jgi:hypothetical protein
LFGKTRSERDGCDVCAIEARKQVFTPSEGGLKKGQEEKKKRKEKERYHTKKEIGENAK